MTGIQENFSVMIYKAIKFGVVNYDRITWLGYY